MSHPLYMGTCLGSDSPPKIGSNIQYIYDTIRHDTTQGMICNWRVGSLVYHAEPNRKLQKENWREQRYRHCDKKLSRLLFDFSIIPLQLLSMQRTHRLRRSHSVDNSLQYLRRSRSVDNSCGLTPGQTGGCWTLLFETRTYPGVWGRIWMRQQN